jgi:hypothetical protein
MLVPGEYLLTPATPVPNTPKPATVAGQSPQNPPAAQPAAARETEPRSFLLTLLRALGAVHS